MPPAIAAVAAFAAAGAVQAFIVQIGISLAISFVARTLFRPSVPSIRPTELVRELAIPVSRPPYRFIYGRYRAYGSPAPWRVKGNTLYGCIIFNSRPSSGFQPKIYLDKRELTNLTGDLTDFSGGGLRGQLPSPAEPFVPATIIPSTGERPRFWLGLGDQTSPPDRIVNNAPEFFQATDGWQGRTVLWVEFDAGPTEFRADRWPRVPPEVELEMNWSFVWDPRDSSQDPDDENTWTHTDNQALVLLDALRRNPIREFQFSNLFLETFIDAANVADEAVPLKKGGAEFRYGANGMIIWDGREIEEQIQPIVDSGAGTLVRAGGRLGYLAGEHRPSVHTVTDILAEGGIEFQRLVPGNDLPSGIKVSFVNPDRDWKESELPPYQVPGAPSIVGANGIVNITLPFCTSPTQAMRIQKIAALKAGQQKRLSCTLPPESFDILAGANITLDLPGLTQLNGLWEIVSMNPGLSLADPEGGVALRVPVQLAETNSAIYDWDSSEEIELATQDFVPTRPPLSPPSDLQATSGPEEVIGGQARIRFSFLPSPSDSVTEYVWQWKKTGEIYEQGGTIAPNVLDPGERVFGHLSLVQIGDLYDIRVRAVSANRVSVWIEVEGILAEGDFP